MPIKQNNKSLSFRAIDSMKPGSRELVFVGFGLQKAVIQKPSVNGWSVPILLKNSPIVMAVMR